MSIIANISAPEEKTLADTPSIDRPLTNREQVLAFLNQTPSEGNNSIATINLLDFDFEAFTEDLLPAQYAELYRAVPLLSVPDALVVAIDEEADFYESIRNLEFISGRHVEALKAKANEIDDCIDRMYSTEDLVGIEPQHSEPVKASEYLYSLRRQIREKPVVKIVRRILLEAIRKKASDIHIRPTEHSADYLLRINGAMVLRSNLSKSYLNAVISRFKILGGMDIAEHRIPQDGGVKLSLGGHIVELRLSVMPTIHGESLVVRLLNTDTTLFTLDDLGLQGAEYEHLLKAANQSHGLVIVCGPTGSGKSTTLYALLQEIKKNTALNIITAEDPVEFHIDDVEQMQVNRKAGYTFAKALRNILRHDPDVIMVGEIRDEETAKMAVESALTGHLVLSTLHSVDAVSSVTRLLEMGVKPYLLKAILSLVVAQRLAKLNCPHCIDDDQSKSAESLRKVSELRHIQWRRSHGCEHCHYTGIKGRKGLYETLTINSELRSLIDDDVNEDQLNQAHKKQQQKRLSDHARELAETGQISATEWIALQINDD